MNTIDFHAYLPLDASNNPHHLCLVTYRLDAGVVPILSPHGNAKELKPFHPTWPSTLQRVKEECSSQGPKETVERVSSQVGGVLLASAPGQLPRNEKQVANQRRKLTKPARCLRVNAAEDDLFTVMQEAHTLDPARKFVRDIKTAPEPAIVLATEQQLGDLVRFATSSIEFGIVTVDPTFCLGEFEVTPLTYRHLLLETKRKPQRPPGIPRSCLNPLQKDIFHLPLFCSIPNWSMSPARRYPSIWY